MTNMEKYQETKRDRGILRASQIFLGVVCLLLVFQAGENIGKFWRTHNLGNLFLALMGIGFLLVILYVLRKQFQKTNRWKASLESDKNKYTDPNPIKINAHDYAHIWPDTPNHHLYRMPKEDKGLKQKEEE